MGDTLPLVSIIIPTHNRAAMLREAMASVAAQIYSHWELLVVDDRSTDETESLVRGIAARDPRVRYLRSSGPGMGATRNTAIVTARGEYLAFLDDDDLWFPDKLEKQVAFLECHPEIGFTYGRVYVQIPDGTRSEIKPDRPMPDTWESLLEGNYVPLLTVVARRHLVVEAGGFDVELTHTADYDLWMSLGLQCRFAGIPDIVGIYRRHGMNATARAGSVFHRDRLNIFIKKYRRRNLSPERQKMVFRRVVREKHILAKAYMAEGNYDRARRMFAREIRRDRLAGRNFINPYEPVVLRIKKLANPYLGWLYCGWRIFREPVVVRRMAGDRLTYYSRTPDAEFWDDRWREEADVEAEYPIPPGKLRQDLEAVFLRYLPRDADILEAGCGRGRVLLALRARGYRVEGVEWAPRTVAALQGRHPGLPVRLGDVKNLDVPEGVYGAYISLGVMEHDETGPDAFLREARRVLAPGGVALISVPWMNPLRNIKARLGFFRRKPGWRPFYQYAFKREDFELCLRRAGFDVLEIVPYDSMKGLSDECPGIGFLLGRKRLGSYVEWFVEGVLRRLPFVRNRVCHMMLFVARISVEDRGWR